MAYRPVVKKKNSQRFRDGFLNINGNNSTYMVNAATNEAANVDGIQYNPAQESGPSTSNEGNPNEYESREPPALIRPKSKQKKPKNRETLPPEPSAKTLTTTEVFQQRRQMSNMDFAANKKCAAGNQSTKSIYNNSVLKQKKQYVNSTKKALRKADTDLAIDPQPSGSQRDILIPNKLQNKADAFSNSKSKNKAGTQYVKTPSKKQSTKGIQISEIGDHNKINQPVQALIAPTAKGDSGLRSIELPENIAAGPFDLDNLISFGSLPPGGFIDELEDSSQYVPRKRKMGSPRLSNPESFPIINVTSNINSNSEQSRYIAPPLVPKTASYNINETSEHPQQVHFSSSQPQYKNYQHRSATNPNISSSAAGTSNQINYRVNQHIPRVPNQAGYSREMPYNTPTSQPLNPQIQNLPVNSVNQYGYRNNIPCPALQQQSNETSMLHPTQTSLESFGYYGEHNRKPIFLGHINQVYPAWSLDDMTKIVVTSGPSLQKGNIFSPPKQIPVSQVCGTSKSSYQYVSNQPMNPAAHCSPNIGNMPPIRPVQIPKSIIPSVCPASINQSSAAIPVQGEWNPTWSAQPDDIQVATTTASDDTHTYTFNPAPGSASKGFTPKRPEYVNDTDYVNPEYGVNPFVFQPLPSTSGLRTNISTQASTSIPIGTSDSGECFSENCCADCKFNLQPPKCYVADLEPLEYAEKQMSKSKPKLKQISPRNATWITDEIIVENIKAQKQINKAFDLQLNPNKERISSNQTYFLTNHVDPYLHAHLNLKFEPYNEEDFIPFDMWRTFSVSDNLQEILKEQQNAKKDQPPPDP